MRFHRVLVRYLPTSLAVPLIRWLVRRSHRPPVTDEQRASLWAATRVHYGAGDSRVAWSWGYGPVVLFVHGWNGRAAQMAPLAERLAKRGYRCICIDVTAHGDSQGSRPSWRHFIEDVTAAVATFGPVFACVGHSAGGLAMLAAHSLRALPVDRFICVCAPSHPFPPIRAVQQLFDPPPRVLKGCRDEIAQQFERTWEELEGGAAWHGTSAPVLLFYDRNDRFVDHTEGDRIKEWLPTALLQKSSGRGHTRVLGSDELIGAISEFLLPIESVQCAVASVG